MTGEFLFTAGFSSTAKTGGIQLTGYAPDSGTRRPVKGEWLEIRTPTGEKVRGQVAWVASEGFSVPSPCFPKPLDRAVVLLGDERLRRGGWATSEVWSCGPDAPTEDSDDLIRQKIETGLRQQENGETLTHDEATKRLGKWLNQDSPTEEPKK